MNDPGPDEPGSSKQQRKSNQLHNQSSFNLSGDATASHHQILRHTRSSGDIESITAVQQVSQSRHSPSYNWVPGQEFSRIQAYDPIQDILLARKYASERKDLVFRQIFRYSKCLDWILMTIGIILAIVGSLITPWLYYWGGVTLHDILIFERCNATKHEINGRMVCDIPEYCGTTFSKVGLRLFYKFLWGWIAYNVLQLGFSICFTVAADRQTKAMRSAYFESIVRKDMAWFDLYADKDFANEMTQQITHIRLGIGDVIPNCVNLLCTVVAMIVLVFFLNFKVALSFSAFIPVSIFVVYIGNWAERNKSFVSDRMFEKANKVAKEGLVNIKVIKMYEAETKVSTKFGEALNDTSDNGKRERRKEIGWTAVAAIGSGSIWLLLNIATSFVFWLGQDQGSFVSVNQYCKDQQHWGVLSMQKFTTLLLGGGLDIADSPGEILLVYFGLMYIALHAIEVPNFISLMKIATKNATDVFFIIDWKSRIDNTSTEGKTPKRNAVGRIDFYNVTFRYPQRPDETVLNIRQLTIFSGQYVAFAGPENSGKNTILKLIPRLYDTCSGFIALDAVNVQNYNIHWLRRQMCIISQRPVIFSGTISENILFGKLDANEDEIIKACELAEVHHVIGKLPHGYNTKITSNDFGDYLTINEKRQLCLARAYLHRSRLILLDDPIQPEDDELEPLLMKFVHHFRDTATVILASSNITGLSKRADCIYYMERGRILEFGSHVQLIQAKGKYYSRLEDTMNCSVDARNKFESQLKAYKYSQLLQKKRKSSMGTTLESSWEEVEGGEPRPRKKSLWNNFLKFKTFTGRKRSSNEDDMPTDAEGEEIENDEKGKSILRQNRPNQEVLEISSLEETYNRYHNARKQSTGGGGYMHNGFGMMGFQRMNFARPMTNFSTQIQKQRHAFSLSFLNTGRQSANVVRGRKLSFHPGLENHGPTVLDVNESRRSGAHVKFSIANRNTKGALQSHPVTGKKSKAKKPDKKSKNVSKSRASNKSGVKHGPSKTVAKLDPGKHGKSTVKQSSSHLSLRQPSKRGSIQAALKTMTNPTSFHLNERVEIDNVSLLSQDMDSFLAEYDAGVSSTLNSQVKGFWRDIFFVVKHDWCFIIPALIASVVLGLSIPYQTWIVGTFFQALGCDHTLEEESTHDVSWLIMYMLVTGAVTAVAAFIQEFFFALAGMRMTRRLREKLFAHILKQDVGWFDDKVHDIGILTFQLYADTMVVHHILLMSYGIVIQAFCSVATSVAFAAVETRDETLKLTIAFIVAMPFLILIVYVSSKKELSETEHFDDRFRAASTFAGEFIVNIQTWFSLGAEPFFISQHKRILDREYRFTKLSSIFISCIHSLVQTSSWLLYGIFILLTLQNYDRGTDDNDEPYQFSKTKFQYPSPLEEPTLIGFIMITTELLIFGAYRTGDLISILTDVEFGKTAAHKIMRILVNEPETEHSSKVAPPDEVSEANFYNPPPEIGLTNITYFYPGRDPSRQDGHLQGISMTIASSSYVAIVGPPGSGKSTLCNIILRMCSPTEGILDFNGDDSYNVSPKVTRRLMGLVEYDPCLFDSSLIENIRFGKCRLEEADQVEVEEATKLSNCHYEILDLPNDYNTLVGTMEKTAQNFSLKQRVSYSRALLRKPKILLVDDATSSVDTDSDHKILEVLANAREGRTLIVFSHKIEPIRDADMIFVLWEGEIVESGPDAFLLGKKSFYYEMYMTQKVLADTMRNSPNQLSTIRYNIKKVDHKKTSDGISPGESKAKLAEIAASRQNVTQRSSSVAFLKFLNDKVTKMKADKANRRSQIEKELPTLEMEEKERELSKTEKRRKSRKPGPEPE